MEQMLASGEITYRQLDYWTREGLLKAEDPEPGSGYVRMWPREECDVAALMARLVKAGFSVRIASRIARVAVRKASSGRARVRIAEGVVITITGGPL